MNVRTRQRFILTGLLAPITLFLGVFFLGPLAIMTCLAFWRRASTAVSSGPSTHNFGRILGFADPLFEDSTPSTSSSSCAR